MKKIYVVGIGAGEFASTEMAMRLAKEHPHCEIVCISSIEEMPMEDRIKSHSIGIHTFKCHPINTVALIDTQKVDRKRKGHERPYKYHR